MSADDQEIQATQSALNTAKIEAAKANSALTTMKASLPAGTTDLKTVTEQSHVLTEAIKTHQEQLKTAQRQLSEFDRQLAGLHADERHATDQITTLKKEHQEAEDDFLSAVTDYFGSDGVAKFAAMREKLGQLPLLQQQTQRYKDDVLKQQTLLAAANKTIGNQPQPALDQLEAQASAAEVEATKAQTAFIEAKQKHDTAQKLLKQAADILAANQTALAAYADLQTLTAVMNGNGPRSLVWSATFYKPIFRKFWMLPTPACKCFPISATNLCCTRIWELKRSIRVWKSMFTMIRWVNAAQFKHYLAVKALLLR